MEWYPSETADTGTMRSHRQSGLICVGQRELYMYAVGF